ncbi:MAG: sirohydrochlorin cobaltochelatase [Butyrivibrio sp.]|nr:sirohydrochlorin cobaltochelatase [Butyrivibrio sp.]
MKKNLVTVLTLMAVTAMAVTGCSLAETSTSVESGTVEAEVTAEAGNSEMSNQEENTEVSDQEAADNVAALIDAIYVQTRTDETDAQCLAAKEAWDALTDAQKELVEGEYADPDYFGRDTGDASKDDPLNGDEIGENEILVVSFGTSFNDSRTADIGGIESAIAQANPDWSVRRAFTSQIIINHIQARDGEVIDNVDQALERAAENGVKNLVIQPTHLMHGAEYDELTDTVEEYADSFESVTIAEPLLGEVGSDATEINEDKEKVAIEITEEALDMAGYERLEGAAEDSVAFVFMGHGTSHTAKVTYSQMQTQMDELEYENVFIGTVEGEPEETACENVIAAVQEAGFSKVILRPLMVVAGDHANNDMAGDDEDSWKTMFEAAGLEVECQIAGLGEIEGIQELYVEHTKEAIESAEIAVSTKGSSTDADEISSIGLASGTYEVEFKTDSSMFHINEAYDGKAELTVKEDGTAYVSIVLPSQKILNLYLGTAADAENDKDNWLEPYDVEVTYSDGTTETVNGFDVPVSVIGEEFDLALIGEKGVWYDHKVSVEQ